MRKTVLAISAISAVLAAGALASGPSSTGCKAHDGGGGGIPSPFVGESNRKVELADGELYTLEGKIVVESGEILFNVDLKKESWLANSARRDNPYYRIMSGTSDWESYAGKSILLVATAHGIVSGGNYEIVLAPVNDDPTTAILPVR